MVIPYSQRCSHVSRIPLNKAQLFATFIRMFTLNRVVVCICNMKMWFTKKHVRIVEYYFATWSYAKVQELFQGEFTDVTPPNKSAILRILNKFCTEYSVWNNVLMRDTLSPHPDNFDTYSANLLNDLVDAEMLDEVIFKQFL